MGKAKKKNNKVNSEKLLKKKANVVKKLNPFEIHVNREKFSIIGRKGKSDRGLPGVSRGKANERRKATLGQEYMKKNKTNKLKDRRIGGGDMTSEEIATARFTQERLSQHSKRKSLFNLNDDEMLTHKGQTLEEIEKFQDTVASDEEGDEEDQGKLDANFTDVAHFGGDNDDTRNRKTAIEDLISDSKRKKAERSRELEELYNMTQKLDEDWKSLIPLVGKMSKSEMENYEKPAPDDYDKALKEMVFEPRGEPTDKLKSLEEITKKEKSRLAKLELERLARMNNDEGLIKPKHRSADDLDDDFFETDFKNKKNKVDLDDENDDSVQKSTESKVGNALIDSDDEDDEEQSDESDDASTDTDDLSDLKEDDTESEEELDDNESEENETNKRKLNGDVNDENSAKKIKIDETNVSNGIQNVAKHTDYLENDVERQQLVEKAKKELPYTYSLPESYEELLNLLNTQLPDYQSVILERIIKNNHPKLLKENSERIMPLFSYLLNYVDDIFNEVTESNVKEKFKIFDRICLHIYDLAHLNPEEAVKVFKENLVKKHDEYKLTSKVYPELNVLCLFKLASLIFPTTDYRHLVVTPCYLFMNQILIKARIRTTADVCRGLFMITILLETITETKRFLPSIFNYLHGLLFLCLNKSLIGVYKEISQSFTKPNIKNLFVITNEASKMDLSVNDYHLTSQDLINYSKNIKDSTKLRVLHTILKLLNSFFTILEKQHGIKLLIDRFINLLEKYNESAYNQTINEQFIKLKLLLNSIDENQKLIYLNKQSDNNNHIKILRLIKPNIINKIYDDRRKKVYLTNEKLEHDKLLHKIKREKKGAIREIRRDTAFINKIKIKKQMEGDVERKAKVKRIYSEASMQQGELNAMDRKNRQK